MLTPDYIPNIEGDYGGRQAFAFAFGYIRALLQMVYESAGEPITAVPPENSSCCRPLALATPSRRSRWWIP